MSIQTVDVVYTAVATAENGRDGRVASDDGKLDVSSTRPRSRAAAAPAPTRSSSSRPVTAPASRARSASSPARRTPTSPARPVTAKVGIGKTPDGGFGLTVEISAAIPNVDAATAKDLVEKAHQVCPYSNATRGNIEVKLTVA